MCHTCYYMLNSNILSYGYISILYPNWYTLTIKQMSLYFSLWTQQFRVMEMPTLGWEKATISNIFNICSIPQY